MPLTYQDQIQNTRTLFTIITRNSCTIFTLALGHSARPLFVGAASARRLAQQSVAVLALVTDYRVVGT